MKLPKSVKVGPAVYSVSADEKELLAACREERSDLLGRTEHRQTRILLRPDQSPSCMRDTLLHECLHAVFEMTGIATEVGPDDEEKFVRRLTPAILDMLRSNAPLLACLVAADE